MPTGNAEERMLIKNKLKTFLLRIDLINDDECRIAKIVEKMSKFFDRTEKRQVNNFTVNFTINNSNVTQKESFDYVLTSEANPISMTFSETHNAFWLESKQYRSNEIYKDVINKTIGVIVEECGEFQSKRIGLRYVNEFECDKLRNITNVYGKRLSTIVKTMIHCGIQSRLIGMEEYNNEGYKMRLQYGIPNKFYPSVLSVYDLLLDIDSYTDSTNTIDEWNEVITNLNHAAYNKFISEMNPKYIEGLK